MSLINGPLVPLEQVGVRVPFRGPPALTLVYEALETRYIDERRWRLLEPFDFASETIERIVSVPSGFETDFASIPRVFWAILPPTGDYGKAAVLHDWLYRTQGRATRAEADGVLMEAMIALGVGWWTRTIIYRGVRLGGAASYHGSAFVALVLAVLIGSVSLSAQLPDPTLTPGVVRPLSKAAICGTKWGKDRRHVTLAMKKQVFASYGIPWSQHAKFEVDHKLPRELGGADDVANLWPQPWAGRWNAHLKDRLENKLHRLLCAGTITLTDAQTAISGDWVAAYARFVR